MVGPSCLAWKRVSFRVVMCRCGVKHLSCRRGSFKEANIGTKSAIIFVLKPGGGGGEAAIGFPMATPSFPWEYLSSEPDGGHRPHYSGVS